MDVSYVDFCQSAKALVKALDDDINNNNDDDSIGYQLCRWEVRYSNNYDDDNDDDVGGVCYLYHPPVSMATTTTITTRLQDDVVEYSVDLEDDTILDDIDAYRCCREPQTNPMTTTTTPTTTTTESFQWTFTVVYSDTYRVPVLYFTVQRQDLTAYVTRWQLLDCLLSQKEQQENDDDDNDNDPWEFVSQEQHPVFHMPSYFLHPCRSSQRLQLLLRAAEGDDDSDGDTNDDARRRRDAPSVVWTWMAMILPAVNQPIPPTYYTKIRQKLWNVTSR
jgi:hypothetical protein